MKNKEVLNEKEVARMIPVESQAKKAFTNMRKKVSEEIKTLIHLFWEPLSKVVTFTTLPSYYREPTEIEGSSLARCFRVPEQRGSILLEMYRKKTGNSSRFLFVQLRNYFNYIIRQQYLVQKEIDKNFQKLLVEEYGAANFQKKNNSSNTVELLKNAYMSEIAVAVICYMAANKSFPGADDWEKTTHPIEEINKSWKGFNRLETLRNPQDRLNSVLLRLLLWMVFPPTEPKLNSTKTNYTRYIKITRIWMDIVHEFEYEFFMKNWEVRPETLSTTLESFSILGKDV